MNAVCYGSLHFGRDDKEIVITPLLKFQRYDNM